MSRNSISNFRKRNYQLLLLSVINSQLRTLLHKKEFSKNKRTQYKMLLQNYPHSFPAAFHGTIFD